MIGLLIGAAVYLVALAKWPAAIAIVILALWAFKRHGKQVFLIAGIGILAAWWIMQAVPAPLPPDAQTAGNWHVQVTSLPLQRLDRWDFTAVIVDGAAANFSVLVHSTDPTPPTTGSRIYLRGSLSARPEAHSTFDYLAGLGVSGELYTSELIVERPGTGAIAWLSRLRLDTIRGIQLAVPGDAGALLAGFVAGDDGRLSPASDDQFRAAGLSHLTAVSGSNLALLLTMIGIATYSSGRNRSSVLIAGVALLWGYALFVGLAPPTLRAALLATMAAGARSIGRPVDLVSLTLLTVPLQIAIRPEDAFSVSFHLSVAASLGLAAGFSRYPHIERRHGLADLLTATAFAQIATLPLIVGVFGTAPILSLLANIAAIPFAGFAFAVALFGSVGLLISTSLGTAMLIPAGWAAEIVLRIADLFGREWSRLEIGPLGDVWMIGLTLLALLLLLGSSGELRLLKKQLGRKRGIHA